MKKILSAIITYLLKLMLLLSIVAISASNVYSQSNAGSYHYLDNTVYYDSPSVGDLSFIKENNKTISVLFTSHYTQKEISGVVENDLESSFKNRLLDNGFILKGVDPTNGADNEIQVLVDYLNNGDNISYLVRILVSKSVKYKEKGVFMNRTLPIWKRVYFGYSNKSNLKTKIRNNVTDGLDQLFKALNSK